MRLPEAVIALLLDKQFSTIMYGDWVLQALAQVGDQETLDVSAIILQAQPDATTYEQLLALLALLMRHYPIDHLLLKQNAIDGQGRELMQGLKSTTLLSLDLSYCGLDGEDLQFAALAKGCPHLSSLSLEGNDLRPWCDAASRTEADERSQSFVLVLRNLLGLVYLSRLRHLNLSKTHVDCMRNYLGAVLWVLVSNRQLERIELRGLGLSKKAFAYCLVACDHMRRDAIKPITLVHESKVNGDFFKDRVVRWSAWRHEANQQHHLAVLSLFTQEERVKMAYRHRDARSDQRRLDADVLSQCDAILRSMHKGVGHLWSCVQQHKKRKEEADISPRSKRQKQAMMEMTPPRISSGLALMRTQDSQWPGMLLFHSPISGVRKCDQPSNQGQKRSHEQENIDPQVAGATTAVPASQAQRTLHWFDLPVELRIHITNFLGESRCPLVIR